MAKLPMSIRLLYSMAWLPRYGWPEKKNMEKDRAGGRGTRRDETRDTPRSSAHVQVL